MVGGWPECSLHWRRLRRYARGRGQSRNKAPPSASLRRPLGPGVGPVGPHHPGDQVGHRQLAGGWLVRRLHRRVAGRSTAPREALRARENQAARAVFGLATNSRSLICGVGAQGEPGHVSTSRGYRCDRGDCAVLLDLTDPNLDQQIDRKPGVHQVFGQGPEPDPDLFGLTRGHCGSSGADS